MVVKFQVERRPISATGKIYRGTGYGDYITVLTDPENSKIVGDLKNGGKPASAVAGAPATAFTTLGDRVRVYGAGKPITEASRLDTPNYSHLQELSGEPWLVHSTHYSIESALESAAPLAGAVGSENVRIIKVISHTTSFSIK